MVESASRRTQRSPEASSGRPETSRSKAKTPLTSATSGTIASASSRALRRRSRVVPMDAVASTSADSRCEARAARDSAR